MMSANNKSMQDFGERYFSGNFYFEINVTKCQPNQLGSLIHATSELKKLGLGYNSGYGHIEVKELQLLERTCSTALVQNGQSFKVKKEFKEENIPEKVSIAIKAWNNFIDQETQTAS